jgi:hypothetical protein
MRFLALFSCLDSTYTKYRAFSDAEACGGLKVEWNSPIDNILHSLVSAVTAQ